ncbi:MAG: imelysin family protein, partial [Chloroflexota bacterium]
MKRTLILLLALVIATIGTVSAQENDDLEALQQAAMETYADIVLASYEDSLTLAIELHDAIDAFLADPSEDTLQAARDAWRASNEPYGQTEAYRFYGG